MRLQQGKQACDIIQLDMVRFLHIRMGSIEILHNNGIQQSYYSIAFKQRHYFSSVFSQENKDISDDIFIELDQQAPPETLSIQRWQNCMIIFTFQIELSELKNRNIIKKRIEGRQHQFLNLVFHIYNEKDILFTDKYMDRISQHYLVIEDLTNIKQKSTTRAYQSLSYFSIKTRKSNFILPVKGATIIIKLPEEIQISSFINDHFNGKSALIDCSKITNEQEIDIKKDGSITSVVKLKTKWGVNLHRYQIEQNVLVEANQLLLYDFEIKFDNTSEIAGCKFKVQHGSKAFQFTEDIDHSKMTKIKKIIYFIIKSDSEEVDLILHKNNKPFSICRVSSSEISQSSMTVVKKKWPDIGNTGKFYGYVKVRGERAKNVSIPQSNKYWRDVLKRKQAATNMLISIQQLSVYFSDNQQLSLVGKVQNEQKIMKKVINLNYYNEEDEPNQEILQFGLKGEESLYLMVKLDSRSNDFCGIGVINTTDLRLGINACEVGYFKNQQKVGTINCIIHKIVFWQFVKPVYQSQPQPISSAPLMIDLFINKITFSSFFYTYKYDNKGEVYCIVQINKVKRVLILDNVEHDELNFVSAPGSDQLNFNVQYSQTLKIKLTFIVSDLGHDEEIYGLTLCKVKTQDVFQKEIKLKNLQIKNDYSVNLGYVSLEVFKGVQPKNPPKPPPPQDHQKKSLGSFDLSQASFDTHVLSNKKSPSRRYSGGYINSSKPLIHDFDKKNTQPNKASKPIVKLPIIKQKKDKEKDTFKDLFSLMKVRKRGHGGNYQQNGNGVLGKIQEKEIKKQRHSFDLKQIEQSNPNLNKNLQMLFPKKSNEKLMVSSRSKQNDYQERLRGLKSVMNQIEDIGQVEPSVRQSRQEIFYKTPPEEPPESEYRPQQAEWEGNQFV